MQGKMRRVSKTEIKAPQANVTTHANDAPKQGSSDDSDSFYNKLGELWEPLGLNLIIDARETSLDLYLFYSEVTRRGGFHQVSRDRKWDEVVSALKLEGSNVKLHAQLEKCYALLLYQFEQLYHYRDPALKASTNTTLGMLPEVSLERKRKTEASLSELMDNEDAKMGTRVCKEMKGAELAEQQVLLLTPSKHREVKKRQGRKHRTAYQIFVKQECARLRTYNESPVSSNMLHMAIDAWKKLSEIEKQPYVEESKKEKERLMVEMSSQNGKEGNAEAGADGDHHVITLQPDAVHSGKMTEEEPKDPLYQVDSDAYSLDMPLPTEASK